MPPDLAEPESAATGPGRGRRGARRRADAGEESPGGGTEAQAKDICLRLLTDRARSRAELADKLAAKGFAAEVAERALDRLAQVGLIDDAAFAEQWVHSRHTYSGKGRRALAEELRRKGVAPADAEPALATVTGADEHARATDLVRRKLQSLPRDLDRDKAIRRLVGMLARRGYDPSTAHAVVLAEVTAAGFQSERARQSASPRTEPSPPSPPDESAAADLIRRKLRSIPPNLDRDKTIRRLVAMLARRGYHQSAAYAIVKAELAAADES
nr:MULTISPECIES: recombination regulator RecX [Nocardia]